MLRKAVYGTLVTWSYHVVSVYLAGPTLGQRFLVLEFFFAHRPKFAFGQRGDPPVPPPPKWGVGEAFLPVVYASGSLESKTSRKNQFRGHTPWGSLAGGRGAGV